MLHQMRTGPPKCITVDRQPYHQPCSGNLCFAVISVKTAYFGSNNPILIVLGVLVIMSLYSFTAGCKMRCFLFLFFQCGLPCSDDI